MLKPRQMEYLMNEVDYVRWGRRKYNRKFLTPDELDNFRKKIGFPIRPSRFELKRKLRRVY